MFIRNEKKILNIIQYATPIFVLITSFFILILLYSEYRVNFKNEISNLKKNFLITKKQEIKNQVKMIKKYIINSKKDFTTLSNQNLENNLINEIRKFEYEKDRYIFIFDYEGNVLVHVNENILDKNIFKIDSSQKRKDEIRDIINLAKQGDGYLTYSQFQKPSTNELTDKTSYIVGLNDFKWLIGTGFYHDDMNNAIKMKKDSLKNAYDKQLKQTVVTTLISTLLMLLLSFYFSKVVKHRFKEYKNEIKKNIDEKEEYTKLLNHQSKMASIGEMLGNIAHQWRQPLTVVSMNANNMKFDIELDDYNKDSFQKNIDEINKQTEYLSKTIDDFRSFFNQNNEVAIFSLRDAVDKTLSFLSTEYSKHNITIVSEVENLQVQGICIEFIQVLINILNNSKDAFEKDRYINSKYIFLNTTVKDKKVSLIIKDNAGGIDEKIIDKIYEPYITNKHQSKGTGVSLYMAKEIISNQMNGEFISENIEYKYKGLIHKGALMKMTFPLCQN